MNRILLLTALVLFIGSSVLAKGPKEDKGGGKGKDTAVKETIKQEKSAETKVEEKTSTTVKTRTDKKKPKNQAKETKKAKDIAKEGREVKLLRKEKEEARKSGEKDDAVEDKVDGEGKTVAKDKGKREKGKGKLEGKGLDKDQREASLAKQREHESAKHQKREARLFKMLKVAQNKGDEKAIERVKSLIEKEHVRYDRKLAKMAERSEKAASEKTAVEKDNDNEDDGKKPSATGKGKGKDGK